MAPVTYLMAVLVVAASPSLAWDSAELEMFDLVEEINQNFYEVMGIAQDATLQEIKKAYRRLSLQLHPDKNDADDAEVKFRQLVAIYDVLRDEGRRAQYERVLVEGLPDWRSPIYYYRRARKMSLLEITIILTVVISFSQYLMAWGSYFEKRRCAEEALVKKYKIKDRKRMKQEDLENLMLMEEVLGGIPKPSWWNILPIQLVRLVIFLVTGGPGLVRAALDFYEEEKKRKKLEKEKEEEEEKRKMEEEERRKEKKASRKEGRKRVNVLPDFSGDGCLLDSMDAPEPNTQRVRPSAPAAPVVSGGLWTDDDFCELARLMAKYPGGTLNRWERIAEMMGRTVFEVTKMSSKLKSSLMQRPAEAEVEGGAVVEAKVKVKTKGEAKCDLSAGSDEVWSPVQQKALEKALKLFPKGTDQRWDKIARAVPEKEKEDCMMRFKFLAEKIKRKKMEEAGRKDGDEEEEEEEEKTEEEEETNANVSTTSSTSTPTTKVTRRKQRRRRRRDLSEEEEEEEEDEEDEE